MSKYIAKKDIEFALTPQEKIILSKGERVSVPQAALERLKKHGVIEAVKSDEETPEKQEADIPEADTFSEMEKEDLQWFLEEAGVKYHHKAGVEKLAELAREVAVQSEEYAEKDAE